MIKRINNWDFYLRFGYTPEIRFNIDWHWGFTLEIGFLFFYFSAEYMDREKIIMDEE